MPLGSGVYISGTGGNATGKVNTPMITVGVSGNSGPSTTLTWVIDAGAKNSQYLFPTSPTQAFWITGAGASVFTPVSVSSDQKTLTVSDNLALGNFKYKLRVNRRGSPNYELIVRKARSGPGALVVDPGIENTSTAGEP